MVHLLNCLCPETDMREESICLNLDGHYRGYLSEGFSHSDIATLFINLDRVEPIRRTKTRRWFHLSFRDGGPVKQVLVKEEEPLKSFQPVKWIRNSLSDSSLARSWRLSISLASKGLPTPRPIALLETRKYWILKRSYFISEFLPDAQPLTDYINDPLLDPVQRDQVLSSLIYLVKTLHQEGFFHADLKGGNILVEKGDDGPKIYFIDLEASRIQNRLNPAKKIKDLSRLNRALIGSVQENDRLRLMRSYLEGQEEFLGRETELLREIEWNCRTRLIKKVLLRGPHILKELRYGIKKILVIKLRYIGDTLLVTPLLDALKDAFPEASISALVNQGTEAVLFNNPLLEEILILDRTYRALDYFRFLKEVRVKKFDLVIDLTDSDRSAFTSYWSGAPIRIGFHGRSLLRNSILYNLLIKADEGALHKIDHHLAVAEAIGHPIKSRELSLFLSPEEIESTRQRLNKMGLASDQPFVVFHPGARRWYKSWPGEYFSELGNKISKELKIQLVLAGGPSDLEVVEKIQKGINYPSFNLAGELDLRELACLLKMAALCVVNDSSPMHIAAALQTPTIALFGLTDYKNWYPRGEGHAIFSQDCPCRHYGHSRECDQGVNNCMRKIPIEDVFAAVKERLGSLAGKNY